MIVKLRNEVRVVGSVIKYGLDKQFGEITLTVPHDEIADDDRVYKFVLYLAPTSKPKATKEEQCVYNMLFIVGGERGGRTAQGWAGTPHRSDPERLLNFFAQIQTRTQPHT